MGPDGKYDGESLYSKVDWEGGLYETAFGYGLSSEAISDSEPELKAAWAAMEKAHQDHFGPAFDLVSKLLEEI